MIRRESRQRGLADSIVRPSTANPFLDQIDRSINWESLRQKMESLYSLDHRGRPAFPVVMLFEALLLQQWYSLSDPAAEEAINDRRSFCRFLGLGLDEKAPDHSTIHKFRDRIAPIMQELLAEVNRQLQIKGLILRKGTLVDAALIKSAAHPVAADAVETSSDPDARWGGGITRLLSCCYSSSEQRRLEALSLPSQIAPFDSKHHLQTGGDGSQRCAD